MILSTMVNHIRSDCPMGPLMRHWYFKCRVRRPLSYTANAIIEERYQEV